MAENIHVSSDRFSDILVNNYCITKSNFLFGRFWLLKKLLFLFFLHLLTNVYSIFHRFST